MQKVHIQLNMLLFKRKTEEALTTICNFDAIIVEGAM